MVKKIIAHGKVYSYNRYVITAVPAKDLSPIKAQLEAKGLTVRTETPERLISNQIPYVMIVIENANIVVDSNGILTDIVSDTTFDETYAGNPHYRAIDGQHKTTVLPFFFDAHTHFWDTDEPRTADIARRYGAGSDYAPGGIYVTSQHIARLSDDAIIEKAITIFDQARRNLEGGIEIKTGYALTDNWQPGTEHGELRLYRLLTIARDRFLEKYPDFEIVLTYLGAHLVPPHITTLLKLQAVQVASRELHSDHIPDSVKKILGEDISWDECSTDAPQVAAVNAADLNQAISDLNAKLDPLSDGKIDPVKLAETAANQYTAGLIESLRALPTHQRPKQLDIFPEGGFTIRNCIDLMKVAIELNIPMTLHLQQTKNRDNRFGIKEAIQVLSDQGIPEADYSKWIHSVSHVADLTREDLDMLNQYDIVLIPILGGELSSGETYVIDPQDQQANPDEVKANSNIRGVPRLADTLNQNGVPTLKVAFASNSNPSSSDATLFEDMKLGWKAGFDPSQVLIGATVYSRQANGLSSELGMIQVGHKANFVAVNAQLKDPGAVVNRLANLATIQRYWVMGTQTALDPTALNPQLV